MAMVRARNESQWNHTSALLWIAAEINRDPKRRSSPYKTSEFNPYQRKRPDGPMPKLKMKDLKNMIISGGLEARAK